MNMLTLRVLANFAKWSKPKPKINKFKEERKSFALGDEKAAKLSKSEQQLENKQKAIEQQKLEEETKKQTKIYRDHSAKLEEYMHPKQLQKIRLHQLYYLKGKTQKAKKLYIKPKPKARNAKYLISQIYSINKRKARIWRKFRFANYTKIINRQLKVQIQEIEPDMSYRRVGTLGRKLGMTTMWNRWGKMVPVTIIQLDRVQIIQIKEPRLGNTLYQVQLGMGQKNMKRISKSLLGHFVKSQVPPKQKLVQFKVSKECLLPVGYMMSSRHYTPGMFVDVIGKTVGHGFQGTIKKHGFSRQPETHGNSKTTRVLGSTGGRQDPGRVFKLKKMYGRMGNTVTAQNALEVFKIDVDKNLLYLKGSVPGKAGSIVKIKDTQNSNKLEKNLELVHYPTFVEKEGVKYARQFSMYCGERDPGEIEVHDNAFILDDQDEDTGISDNKDALPEE